MLKQLKDGGYQLWWNQSWQAACNPSQAMFGKDEFNMYREEFWGKAREMEILSYQKRAEEPICLAWF